MVELSHCRRARFQHTAFEQSPARRLHLCIHIDHDTRGLRRRQTKREYGTTQQTENWSHRSSLSTAVHLLPPLIRALTEIFLRRSEHQLGPELDHTRSHALHAATDGAESCRSDISVDCGRIRVEMIRQVEDFRPEFEESSLVQSKRLVYREVCVGDTRQPNGVGTRRRAEAAE